MKISPTIKFNISMPPRIHSAIVALAEIKGKKLSPIISEACEYFLQDRQLLNITPEMMQEQLQATKPQPKKRQRPTPAEIAKNEARLSKYEPPKSKSPAKRRM